MNAGSTLIGSSAGTSVSKGRLVFHITVSVELGALLWVIELGGHEDKQQAHSLGHGKPLGAGIVSIQSNLTVARQASSDVQTYIKQFEQYMNEAHPGANERSWFNSPQLEYLRAFTAYEDNVDVDTPAIYEY